MLKKILFSLFFIQFGLLATARAATPIPQCIQDIAKEAKFYDGLKEVLKNKELNQENIKKNQDKVYDLVAENVITHCLGDINTFVDEIADQPTLRVPFEMRGTNNKTIYYAFEMPTEKLFDHINIPTGIVVAPAMGKKRGDVITFGEMPRDYFWSESCSDHWVKLNIDDNAPVNTAGRASFKGYPDVEFFLDFPKGSGMRAFPGLVLGAATGIGGKEQIVWFRNYLTARKAAEEFATNLKQTICTQDNLEVYLVSLGTQKVKIGDSKYGWGITAGATGGVMGVLAIGSFSVPVVGWIIGGVVAISAGVVTLWVETLADIQQVMVLDGPHKI